MISNHFVLDLRKKDCHLQSTFGESWDWSKFAPDPNFEIDLWFDLGSDPDGVQNSIEIDWIVVGDNGRSMATQIWSRSKARNLSNINLQNMKTPVNQN